MVNRIAFIDDEKSILNSFRRTFSAAGFDVFTTDDPGELLNYVNEHKVGVVFSDHRMPKMVGTTVLKHVKEINPAIITVMITGYADMAAAIDAINQGNVFRFIEKPWDNQKIIDIAKECLEIYNLKDENKKLLKVTQEQNAELMDLNENLNLKVEERTVKISSLNEKLEKGFIQSIGLINKISELHHASISAHSKRVHGLTKTFVDYLKLDSKEKLDIQIAALLHDIGKISLATDVLSKEYKDLNDSEKTEMKKHVIGGSNLVKEVEKLDVVSNIILHHHEQFNGKGYPNQLSEDRIPLGSRIISIIDAYDKAFMVGGQYDQSRQPIACEFIRENGGVLFDPELVEKFFECIGENAPEELEVSLDEMYNGMVLSRDVKTFEGKVILKKDSVLKTSYIEKIIEWLSKDPFVQKTIFIKSDSMKQQESSEESSFEWG